MTAIHAADQPDQSNAPTQLTESSEQPARRIPLTFVGTLPPPVSGMTVMTKVIVDRLAARGDVRILNWSPGRPMKGARWKLARARGFVKSLLKILLGRRRDSEVIYTPASSRWGQIYDLALGTAAKLRGYRLVVHHHVYSYIDQRDWRAAVLNWLVGPHGGHVVHCETMINDYRAQYETAAEFLIVPPTIVSQESVHAAPEADDQPQKLADGVTLGLLSNLKLSKGLDTAIACFESLVQSIDAKLILAGPCMGSAEKQIVDDALAKWPDRVSHLGPVSGEAKAKFFCDIDVFLFPTRYPNESWGIVLTEALAAGKPVIAHDRGCIRHIVRGECGLVVPRDKHFVAPAVKLICQWISDPSAYAAACRAALARTIELEKEADRDFDMFVDRLLSFGESKKAK